MSVCNKFCNLGGERVRKSVGSAGAWDTLIGKEWSASDWERMASIGLGKNGQNRVIDVVLDIYVREVLFFHLGVSKFEFPV